MGFFWMFEAMPLGITALLPVVLFPLFGLQSTSKQKNETKVCT